MVYCVAYGCQNRDTDKIPGVTFHIFPKDEQRRAAWTKAVRRANWAPSPRSHLCSVHFCKEFIDRTSLSVVRLRENAVPTIFSEYPTYLRSAKTKKKRRIRKKKAADLEIDHLESPEASTSKENWGKPEIEHDKILNEENECYIPLTKINSNKPSGQNNVEIVDIELLNNVFKDHLVCPDASTSQEDWAKQEIKQEEISDEDNDCYLPFTKINSNKTSDRNNLITIDVQLLRKVTSAVNKLRDDCYIFGDFVANQLRLISVQSLRMKLQSRIQKAILRVAEEDELLQ